MSKRTVIGIISILMVIAIFGVTFFLVDFNLVLRNNEPILSINTNVYDNGTTKEYVGLGYKIIRYNIKTENLVNKFGTWLLMYDYNFCIKEENIESNKNDTYDIIGEIISFDEKELSLYVKSNSSESNYNEAIVRVSSNTIIKKNNKEIYIKDLKAGNKVKIKFTGIVTYSIPPQAIASRIIVE